MHAGPMPACTCMQVHCPMQLIMDTAHGVLHFEMHSHARQPPGTCASWLAAPGLECMRCDIDSLCVVHSLDRRTAA